MCCCVFHKKSQTAAGFFSIVIMPLDRWLNLKWSRSKIQSPFNALEIKTLNVWCWEQCQCQVLQYKVKFLPLNCCNSHILFASDKTVWFRIWSVCDERMRKAATTNHLQGRHLLRISNNSSWRWCWWQLSANKFLILWNALTSLDVEWLSVTLRQER